VNVSSFVGAGTVNADGQHGPAYTLPSSRATGAPRARAPSSTAA
jgi:hypothetical protein